MREAPTDAARPLKAGEEKLNSGVWGLDELLASEEEGATCPIMKPETALMRFCSYFADHRIRMRPSSGI